MAGPDSTPPDPWLKPLLKSALFFAVAPGLVAGLLPALITGWEADERLPVALRGLGLAVGGGGLAFLVHSFGRFVFEGFGTPAPMAPTRRLVVGGAYRFVRNPMYLAVLAVIAGQALFLASAELAGYGALAATGMIAFARLYEEPALRARFGAQYQRYHAAVPGWLPRLTPWRDPSRPPPDPHRLR